MTMMKAPSELQAVEASLRDVQRMQKKVSKAIASSDDDISLEELKQLLQMQREQTAAVKQAVSEARQVRSSNIERVKKMTNAQMWKVMLDWFVTLPDTVKFTRAQELIKRLKPEVRHSIDYTGVEKVKHTGVPSARETY